MHCHLHLDAPQCIDTTLRGQLQLLEHLEHDLRRYAAPTLRERLRPLMVAAAIERLQAAREMLQLAARS